jgi:hypothetical protein
MWVQVDTGPHVKEISVSNTAAIRVCPLPNSSPQHLNRSRPSPTHSLAPPPATLLATVPVLRPRVWVPARGKNSSEVRRTRGVPRRRGCPACLYLPTTRGTPAATSFAVLYCSVILLFALISQTGCMVSELFMWHSGEVVCDDMLPVLGIHCKFFLFAGMSSVSILNLKTRSSISYRAFHCLKLSKLLPRTISKPCIASLLSCTILFNGDP